MQPDPIRPEEPAPKQADGLIRNKATLELAFITATGVLVLCAFIAALTYEGSSGVAPLCIMVPLLVLIGFQIKRSLQDAGVNRIMEDLRSVVRGENRIFNAILVFIGWMTVLVALIFVVGHYIGIAVFMFVLLRLVSRESVVRSAGVSASVTLIIYLLFEYAFRIEMYRGLIDRLF